MEAELLLANARILSLTESIQEQCLLIDHLTVCINSMEGKLCSCNKENEEVPEVLGSLIMLHHNTEAGPSDTFHTPLTSESLTSSSSQSSLVETLVEVVENGDAIPIPGPTTLMVRVCDQQAHCSSGLPKSCYNPYPHCCLLGSRSSTHWAGSLCL